MTPVKDQERRGACCVFAVVGLYEACLKRFYPNEPYILSEQAYLSYLDKDGTSVSDIKKIIKREGFIWDSPRLPYKGQEKDKPHWRSAKVCDIAARLPRKKYRLREELDAEEWGCGAITRDDLTSDFSMMLLNLSRMQMPMTAYLHTACDDWIYANGKITKFPSKKYIEESEDGLGHHAVLITGYDIDKELLFFKNSWGKDWGDEGYGTITFKAFAAHHGAANLKKNYDFYSLMCTGCDPSKLGLWGFERDARGIIHKK